MVLVDSESVRFERSTGLYDVDNDLGPSLRRRFEGKGKEIFNKHYGVRRYFMGYTNTVGLMSISPENLLGGCFMD